MERLPDRARQQAGRAPAVRDGGTLTGYTSVLCVSGIMVWIEMCDLNELTQRLAAALLQCHQSLAVAESCTGGWVAKVLTDLPGSSRWFERGFVSYSNAAKQDMLGVSAATLDATGAVSEATVREMAAGVLAHSPADLALAISGIAGPGGEVPGKQVGTVCFAWATRTGLQRVETVQFGGDREAVRRQSVAHALQGLIDVSGSA